ncbi:hypothetical protein [Maledivibacter halophilus]|uniref:hypothetical protein n=1 Tax=Maledivibacter halophilus TaxID=36842 RepID=UPI0011174487|nr:hypothetical protein [Maledivibacter halophilus]
MKFEVSKNRKKFIKSKLNSINNYGFYAACSTNLNSLKRVWADNSDEYIESDIEIEEWHKLWEKNLAFTASKLTDKALGDD